MVGSQQNETKDLVNQPWQPTENTTRSIALQQKVLPAANPQTPQTL